MITIPFWVFVLLLGFSIWSVLERILLPSVKWVLRKRVNRVINEINTRLDIEIRPFQLTKRQVLLDRLVYDSQVMEAVRNYSLEKQIPREVVQDRVHLYAKEIVPSFNAYIYFRFGYWLAKRAAKLLYRVRVGFLDDNKIATIGKNSTVVFVMNHRSNMDYILVSFLAADRTALSYAVGEWARIWPLSTLIKAMGAFFIRRNSKNSLYRLVLARYIHMASKEGVCQAVFLEGGLSKDGRVRQPKLGFLDYMIRSYDLSIDRDIVFVPVGINYDRTLEDRSLLRGLEKKADKRSKWFVLMTAIGFILHNIKLVMRSRWRRFGYATVYFGKPISMRNYCINEDINFKSLPQEQRFTYIISIADNLMEKIKEVIPVLPTSLIANVLLRQSNSLSGFEIKAQARDLINNLKSNGAPIALPERARDHILSMALEMLVLRHIIEESDDIYHIKQGQEQILTYYANSIAHWL